MRLPIKQRLLTLGTCVGSFFAVTGLAAAPTAPAPSEHLLERRVGKNELPCVADVCLGDGLATLAHIKWDTAPGRQGLSEAPAKVSTLKLSASELAKVSETYVGDIEIAAPYLHLFEFDNDAIDALQKVTGACGPNKIYGRYTSANGNPTKVGISLLSRQADGAEQAWTVVEITREIPGARTAEQVEFVNREMEKRYHQWDVAFNSEPRDGTGVFFSYFIGHPMFTLELRLPSNNSPYQNSSCAASQVVRLD